MKEHKASSTKQSAVVGPLENRAKVKWALQCWANADVVGGGGEGMDVREKGKQCGTTRRECVAIWWQPGPEKITGRARRRRSRQVI